MKTIVLILMLSTVAGGAMSQQTSKQVSDNFTKLSWLEGTWTNLKNKPGQSGYERWSRSSPTELRGVGVTMEGTDTVFVEKLRILVKDDNLYYVADVRENQKPVFFKLTEVNRGGFVCENAEHDFPKKIEYRVDEGQLKARISGNGKAIDFLFRKE